MTSILVAARARLAQAPLVRRFLTGAAWSVSGSVVTSGITLVMFMLVARLLGKEAYGGFVVIQSTLSMVGVLAGFGIGATATRYAAALKTDDPVRLGHIITLGERTIVAVGLIATSGLVFAADWIAAHVLNARELSAPLAIAALAVFFAALDSYQKSILIGFESMRALVIATLTAAIAGVPIMLLAVAWFGLRGAAVALVINALLQACVSRHQMGRQLNTYKVIRNARGCLREWPVLWRFALPALLSGALVSPAHWAAQAMLANSINGYSELAVLGIAMQWLNVTMFIPSAAARVVLPMLTEHVATNDHGSSKSILLYSIGVNALAALPMAVLIAVLSDDVMQLYGASFEGTDRMPLLLAALAAGLVAIQTPVGNLLAASSRMWLGTVMNAGWACVYVGLAYILADKGAVGIMLALTTAYVVHTLWVGRFALNQFKKT